MRETAAFQHAVPGEVIKVQIADPVRGTASGFTVNYTNEPGNTRVWVRPAAALYEVENAALIAKQEIEFHKTIAAQNEPLIDKIRDAYPQTLPSHITISRIPADVVSSALKIRTGNTDHLILSQYLNRNVSIPLTHKLVNMLLAAYGHVVIAIFDGDGSIMVFVPKLSSSRYEPLSLLVVDSSGNVLRPLSGGVISGGGYDGYAGGYVNNGGSVYRCVSWVTVKGTTADGTYCDRYSRY